MKQGTFIVFEGINGCGKGTQLELVTNWLYDLDKSHLVLRTREPNQIDENGMLARKMLSESKDSLEGKYEAVNYFSQNRISHNEGLLKPVLENKGTIVLSDRYWHSNFAFQGAMGVSIQQIQMANSGHDLLKPDLTIIYDLPVSVADERLSKRDGENRRKFDSDLEFLNVVRSNYLNLQETLRIFDPSIVYVDATQSIVDVFEETKQIISDKLGYRR